jgi:hypothetical protein
MAVTSESGMYGVGSVMSSVVSVHSISMAKFLVEIKRVVDGSRKK